MKAKVVSGKKEGEKYIPVYAQKIEKLLKMKPFPGTLNLKVDFIPPLDTLEIPSFGQFSAIELAPCTVNYERAFAVFPEKGGYREQGIVEVIAEKNLKAHLGLEDGDFVDLQF
jgi:CTP-dependent riboflavin kinase